MKGSETLEKQAKTLEKILDLFPAEERFSLAILQAIQNEYGYIAEKNLKAVSAYLKLPVSQVFSMATFYKALSLNKKGKLIIKVCDGTACHIRGSQSVLSEIQRILHIAPGETTEDGLFSLEIVNCVGSCAIAPVAVCDDTFYGGLTPQKAREIVNHYQDSEKEAE